jgi:hypothetical protein
MIDIRDLMNTNEMKCERIPPRRAIGRIEGLQGIDVVSTVVPMKLLIFVFFY